jgi:putative addiction module component (TIGR02574 family)
MSIANDVLSQALGLPAQQRRDLALRLLESLPPEEERSNELDLDYEAELLRRVEEIDAGKAKMLTMDEVMAGLPKRRGK